MTGVDPEGVPPRLERFRKAAGREAGPLLTRKGAPEALATLLSLGDAPARALAEDPAALTHALEGRPRLPSPADAAADLPRIHRREVLRILLADAHRGAPLEEVAAALSDLADATIAAVLARAPDPGAPLACLAMGKLGGRELNYSSDVDLLFLHGGEDPERPAATALAAAKALGAFYRVDLRLRPHGGVGALVPAAAAAVHYYRTAGSAWERQALLKARPAAGDLVLGATFLRELEPWIHGRPLRMAEIDEIRRLKRAIEEQGSAPAEDLKTGPGGIRDVEYAVQFLQLLLGAEHPEVRTGNTLEGLRRLRLAGALSDEEADGLDASYRFHRLAEHRLQAADDLQVHVLPPDEPGLARLARRMGLSGLEEFRELRIRHRAVARAVLHRLVHGSFRAGGERDRVVVDLLLDPATPPEARVEEALRPFGIRDAARAFADLRSMASARSPWLRRSRVSFASVAPTLLERAAATPDPDRALSLLERLAERAAGSGLFYRLLTENPDVLGLFCDLGGSSPWLADLLWTRPTVMDAFLDALVVAPRDGLPPFEDLPLEHIADAPDPGEVLRDLRDLELLRIGARDLQGRTNARQTAAQVTAVGEAIVRLAAEAAGASGLAVIALGRLGAGEMAYGSDLDLLFVHGPGRSETHARRARALVALLSGGEGREPIWPVDLRLRPEGGKGTLVVSRAALLRYGKSRAATWERQALVRARAVGGDPALCREVMEAIAEVLWGKPPAPDVVAEVAAMRRRVEEAGTPGSLKTGRGGAQDAEFLVQALLLRHGHDHPAIRRANTVEALGALRDAGLLAPADHEALATAYLFLRTVEMRLRLCTGTRSSVFPAEPAERDALARRLGYVATSYASAGKSLADEVAWYREQMRRTCGKVLESSGG